MVHDGQKGGPRCHEKDWDFNGPQNGRIGKRERVVQPISNGTF